MPKNGPLSPHFFAAPKRYGIYLAGAVLISILMVSSLAWNQANFTWQVSITPTPELVTKDPYPAPTSTADVINNDFFLTNGIILGGALLVLTILGGTLEAVIRHKSPPS